MERWYKENMTETDINQVKEKGASLGLEFVELENFYALVDLEEEKETKLKEMKEIRDKAELMPVNGFDVDEKSLMRISNAITVLGVTQGTIEWTLADNTTREVNVQDLQSVILGLAQQSNDVHEKYRELKARINACEKAQDVWDIIWD